MSACIPSPSDSILTPVLPAVCGRSNNSSKLQITLDRAGTSGFQIIHSTRTKWKEWEAEENGNVHLTSWSSLWGASSLHAMRSDPHAGSLLIVIRTFLSGSGSSLGSSAWRFRNKNSLWMLVFSVWPGQLLACPAPRLPGFSILEVLAINVTHSC